MSDQYSHADGSRECRPVVGHGSTLRSTPAFEQTGNSNDPLWLAAYSLYMAGRWTCDRAVDAAGLWTALRDALGLPAGTATKAGIGQTESAGQPLKLEISIDATALKESVSQLERLQDRVNGLLEANNREVERRRAIEGAARALRAAQNAYMADRGNDELGKDVGAAAVHLDHVLNGAEA